MKNHDFLNELRIASPCPVGWEQMGGNERVRHCRLCDFHVYNISEMTRKEAQSLIEQSDGRICARLFRRADGTVITRDCPVGLRAVRRRVAKTATAVFTAILSLTATVVGQKPSKSDKGSCAEQVKITRKASDSTDPGMIALQLLDPSGATVAGAHITIHPSAMSTNVERSGKASQQSSNDEGRVEFAGLVKGPYDLKIEAQGFKSFLMKNIEVGTQELISICLTLEVSQGTETVGLLLSEPSLIDKPIGTTIISREMIDRLPHQN